MFYYFWAWKHSFSMQANFSENVTYLRMGIKGKKCYIFGKFYVSSKCMIPL